MRNVLVLCMLAACNSNDPGRHIADGAGSGSGSGGGSGMPEPCAMMISSTQVTAMATDTQCGQQLVNQTTVAINFTAIQDANIKAMSEIACTIMPGIVPQTLSTRDGSSMGCNVEVDYYNMGGILDEWDNSSSGTVSVTVTDLAPLGGTINLSLFDSSSAPLTVTGTF